MSRSDVVRRLRALASRGIPMSVRHLLPTHAELVGQALATFGGFDRARAIAGLEAPPLAADPDTVIGALRSLARCGVRLDVPTLSTMGEGGLVAACIEAFGGVPAAAARAGIGVAPEPPKKIEPRHEPGFAQPAVSRDGQVSTAQALEILQQTAVSLGRVPAARDLPPDVARRLTQDYGSVRFAYLALRVHAEGTAESAQAAAEPVAHVSAEAFAATARLSDVAGQHRRAVENRAPAPEPAPAPVPVPSDLDVDALFAELDARIDEAAAVAAAQLRDGITAAMESFIDEVTALAKRHTLESLLPFTEPEDQDEDDEDDEPQPEPVVEAAIETGDHAP